MSSHWAEFIDPSIVAALVRTVRIENGWGYRATWVKWMSSFRKKKNICLFVRYSRSYWASKSLSCMLMAWVAMYTLYAKKCEGMDSYKVKQQLRENCPLSYSHTFGLLLTFPTLAFTLQPNLSIRVCDKNKVQLIISLIFTMLSLDCCAWINFYYLSKHS